MDIGYGIGREGVLTTEHTEVTELVIQRVGRLDSMLRGID
jgi:hypothetical protein